MSLAIHIFLSLESVKKPATVKNNTITTEAHSNMYAKVVSFAYPNPSCLWIKFVLCVPTVTTENYLSTFTWYVNVLSKCTQILFTGSQVGRHRTIRSLSFKLLHWYQIASSIALHIESYSGCNDWLIIPMPGWWRKLWWDLSLSGASALDYRNVRCVSHSSYYHTTQILSSNIVWFLNWLRSNTVMWG